MAKEIKPRYHQELHPNIKVILVANIGKRKGDKCVRIIISYNY